MGTSENPTRKATEDYNTRSADSLGIDKASATFVFVTPRRWPRKKDWEDRRRQEGQWHDVRVLDADDIEQALEEAAAVRIWLSELLEMPALGVATIEEWWRRFSNGFDPLLTPDVVLAGREDSAAALLRRLAVDVGRTFIKAASVDDGLAFAVCAMMAQGIEQSEPMLSRSLLVHDGSSLRRLDSTSSLLILLPYEENLQREAQLVQNHHVVFVVTDGDAEIELLPLDHLSLQAALRQAGVGEADLDRFARAGVKSLLALQRVATRFGQLDPDQWTQDLAQRPLRRAWLAGAWSQLRSGDVDILEGLTGIDKESLAEQLEAVARQADPMFTRVGGTWAVAAPEDSWRTARHSIRETDLDALEVAVQNVLGAVDPRLELPPEDRWSAAVYGKTRVHSSDLRKGLARSVALLGSRGDEVRLPGGRSARQWAERVVWRLVSRANQDNSAQLWASMDDVIPLLAEAAPDVFLRAVAEAASGSEPLLRKLFQDQDESWHASSPHTGLLWALECVAWSNRHMGFAAQVLASLAEIDPGGKLSNRPAASLRDIFRPWLPQTSAPAESRVMTLDALLHRHREVTWELMLRLLPGQTEVGMNTYKPRFRDWVVPEERTATYAELFSFLDVISERLVQMSDEEPQRWIQVVGAFDRLPDEGKRAVLARLVLLRREALEPEVVTALWDAIEDFVRKHRQYPDAEWSLPDKWLVPLEAVAEALKPARPSEAYRWLFDDWTPNIGVSVSDDFATYDAAVKLAREAAAEQIINEQGFDAMVQLASEVSLPRALGQAAAEIDELHDAEALSFLDSEDGQRVQFADGFARARFAGTVEDVRPWVEHFSDRPIVQARLLDTILDVTKAWDLLSALGEEVDAAYWAEFVPYGRGADFQHVNEVARQLLRHGRVAMAVHTLSLFAERLAGDVDVSIVMDALNQFGTVEDPEGGRVKEHDLTRLLNYVRSHVVHDTEIARLEWKFLPALHYESKALSLQRLLARDPTWFVSLIELAFKPANSRRGEPREVNAALAANAYRLLREWHVVPGTTPDGTVDGAALQAWLDDVRVRLADSDRLEIGELQIGEVFAYAPSDPDGTFPTRPVRDVLESAPNDRLERGFAIGLHNKRGVTSRGMTEGGKQEYELADGYEAWALLVDATHPRTAAALRLVAESYRDEGRRNDDEARRFLEGLDS
ncbi:hypothetical protein [Arthrobacter sp. OY3WO11]|uniref:hypothetical protein n=1 Tax=Arthrobacter sp. OY3WO11 TaxID=1835723 RepID=UPI0012E8C6F7|nr:hypothetical protein [Arthrobacter sp. OY3WO11]